MIRSWLGLKGIIQWKNRNNLVVFSLSLMGRESPESRGRRDKPCTWGIRSPESEGMQEWDNFISGVVQDWGRASGMGGG